MTARGNPSQIEYKWSRLLDSSDNGLRNASIDSNRFISIGPILNISGVLRTDSGVYKLNAINELGSSETAVKINVRCKSLK